MASQRAESKISVVSETAGLINDTRMDRVYGKSSRILVPIFVLCIVWNHIDRTNLAFAALTMNRDLGFDAATYGLGSALFFPTFCLFQIPSNLIMLRVGVRFWLSFLLVGWGAVAMCFALMHNKMSFFVLRLMLGVFESGAAPAMWYQLSQFYLQERIIKPLSYMSMGILIANVLGAPLAAGFLSMDGLAGLQGWRWLFILEGVPSVLLGVVVFCLVPDSPDRARWLNESDKALLKEDMRKSLLTSPPREHIPRNPFKLLGMVLSNPLLLYMCVVGFLLSTAAYTYIFWLPIIVNALLNGQALTQAATSVKPGNTTLLPVLLTSVPYTVGAITTWIAAHSSEKRQELYWHCSLCLIFSGVFFALFPVMGAASIAAGFASLVLTVGGAAAANGPGLAIVMDISRGPSQVVGMPLYNSLSVMGGFAGPFLTGALVQRLGGFKLVTVIMGALLLVCGIMVALLKPLTTFRNRRLDGLVGSSKAGPKDEEVGQGQHDHCSDGGSSYEGAAVNGRSNADGGPEGRQPSAVVLVGPLQDAGVGGSRVHTAGAAAGLAPSAAADNAEWHRRSVAQQQQQRPLH